MKTENLQKIQLETDLDLPKNSFPIVSFGVPVRNGERFLPRLLDSLLAQDFEQFEVVIGDNLSDDRTEEICTEYAARDSRIKYFRHPQNLGQNRNFDRVVELSQGTYFRWIGDDDWVEPEYTRKCVEFLNSHPDFIAVTTEQDHVHDDGTIYYREYKGKRLDSPQAHVRFGRMIWFMTADFGYIDPVYTMYRREALLKTHGMQVMPAQDQVLAVELSLIGRFGHISECLAHRRRESFKTVTWDYLFKHYEPNRHEDLQKSFLISAQAMWGFVRESSMPFPQKLLCVFPVFRYGFYQVAKKRLNRFRSALRLRTRLRSIRDRVKVGLLR